MAERDLTGRRAPSAALALSACAFLLCGHVDAALAAEPGEDAELAIRIRTPWECWNWPHRLMLGLAAAGAAFGAVAAFATRRDALLPREMIDTLRALLRKGDASGALELCGGRGGLATVVRAGLTAPEGAAAAAARAADRERRRLRRLVDWLLLLGLVPALTGMAACVLEVSRILNTVAALKGAVNPGDVADSLCSALWPVWHSLIAAIAFLCAWWFLRNRAEATADRIARTAEELVGLAGAAGKQAEAAREESA